ncbi:MAG TPA: SDR family oxidoreductase [Vicinamibacteria bacterium]
MRVLILGGDGMLGHQLVRTLRERHEVRATFRAGPARPDAAPLAPEARYPGVDVRQPEAVLAALADFQPEAVVNAVGLVKQRPEAKEALAALQINAVFPHQLALLCRAARARVIHLSTDCVFSGRKGRYTEQDPPDAEDLYGRSKLLGEVSDQDHVLTLRTSMIGLEVARRTSLVEWFLAQPGAVRGFTGAIFSGLTTFELARLIDRLLQRHPDLHGLWHVAAAPISKYDLLRQLAAALGRSEVRVEPSGDLVCDRSLDGEAFRRRTGYEAPPWEAMLRELAEEVRRRAPEVPL